MEPLRALRQRLRPTNFQIIMQRAISKLGECLANHLMQQSTFGSETQIELFVANCRDDLRTVLVEVAALDDTDMAPLVRLWDGCALLSLTPIQAADSFAALRQVHRCAPASDLRKPWR